MNARLRERHLTRRPRIIAGPGCFLVERLKLGRTYGAQVRVADNLPEAFDIAHSWLKGAK